MEKDNQEIMENKNTEHKENNTEKKEQSNKKKSNRKKMLWITWGIVLVLCLGIFIFIRINTTETHVYEEVENLAEREGVCFDNLLLSSMISLYSSSGEELRELCIFNNGDVYCFEWPERSSWNIYHSGHEEEGYKVGYDETVWERMCNVVYLGRLSNWDTTRLNQYVQNFDIEGDYYNKMEGDSLVGPDSNEHGAEFKEEGFIWKYYNVRIYEYNQTEEYKNRNTVVESCEMNYLDNNVYEKGELIRQAYDKNAIAAVELFESSGFYDRWVAMCLKQ